MRNFFSYLILLIPLFYLILVFFIYVKQRELLYHPSPIKHDLDYYSLDGVREITLKSNDNYKIQAWYKKPTSSGFMTIFLPGNAGNIEDRIDKLKMLIELGDGFLIPAWRGFGKSEGMPTLDGLYMDAKAAIDFVISEGFALNNVIMIGESLGTGVAVEMALTHKFKGVFLITPYTSIADRAGEIYPFLPTQVLTKDNFKVLDKIDQIKQPLLILHGTNDAVVHYSHSLKIFAKALEPKDLITYMNAGHNDYDVRDGFSKMQKFFTNIP